jgi:hypothetical protein
MTETKREFREFSSGRLKPLPFSAASAPIARSAWLLSREHEVSLNLGVSAFSAETDFQTMALERFLACGYKLGNLLFPSPLSAKSAAFPDDSDFAYRAKLQFNISVRKTADNLWLMWVGTQACTWEVGNAGFLAIR